MIVGEPRAFAIEAEIESRAESYWIFGHLRFWIYEQPVGDWEDLTALQICAGWMRDFVEKPIDRAEPQLYTLSKEEIFHLYDSYMKDEGSLDSLAGNVFTRFNIAHLGMSTFDQYDLLLLEDSVCQRILWRSNDTYINEAYFDIGTIQRGLEQFLCWFESQRR